MINKENIARPDSCVGPECRIIDGKLNGTCISLWPDSTIKSKGTYVNDTVAGKFLQWYENGQLEVERILSDDNKNGSIMRYWQNGGLKTLSIFEDGRVDQRIEWNENGSLYIQELYSDSGSVSITKYRPNGELEYSGSTINGSRSGQWRTYDKSGRLCLIREYDQGKIISEEQFCP